MSRFYFLIFSREPNGWKEWKFTLCSSVSCGFFSNSCYRLCVRFFIFEQRWKQTILKIFCSHIFSATKRVERMRIKLIVASFLVLIIVIDVCPFKWFLVSLGIWYWKLLPEFEPRLAAENLKGKRTRAKIRIISV